MKCTIIYFFFFFPAEDGIRDGTVTGVQTCALPIFGLPDLPEMECVLADGAGSGDADAVAGWPESAAGVGLSMTRFITTLPSNLTTSPPPVILSLSAVSVPFSNLTSTCSSEVTVPLAISTNAWR